MLDTGDMSDIACMHGERVIIVGVGLAVDSVGSN